MCVYIHDYKQITGSVYAFTTESLYSLIEIKLKFNLRGTIHSDAALFGQTGAEPLPEPMLTSYTMPQKVKPFMGYFSWFCVIKMFVSSK